MMMMLMDPYNDSIPGWQAVAMVVPCEALIRQFLSSQDLKEFVSVMNGLLPRSNNTRVTDRVTYMSPLSLTLNLPQTVDWRTKGYVTAVKNQVRCTVGSWRHQCATRLVIYNYFIVYL